MKFMLDEDRTFPGAGRRLFVVALVALAMGGACSDDDANTGWEVTEYGGDAGADGDAKSPTDSERDSGDGADADDFRCEGEPRAALDGVREQVLLANSGGGEPFGHPSTGSSWAVACVLDDGSVRLDTEHLFNDEEMMELHLSGKRAYLGAENEPRLIVLDATRGFDVLAEHRFELPESASSVDELPPPISGAAHAGRPGRHYVSFLNNGVLAVVAESGEPGEVTYLDLSDEIGPDAAIGSLHATAGGHIVGAYSNRQGHFLFSLDPSTNTLVDLEPQADGLQSLELPYRSFASYLGRLASGDPVLSLSPGPIGTANPDAAGGLVQLHPLARPGAYELGEYLVTAEALRGNPLDFIILEDDRALVTVYEESGGHGLRFVDNLRGDAPVVELASDLSPIHVCASSDKREVWVPQTDGVYRMDLNAPREPALALDEQPEMVPHHCIFAP